MELLFVFSSSDSCNSLLGDSNFSFGSLGLEESVRSGGAGNLYHLKSGLALKKASLY